MRRLVALLAMLSSLHLMLVGGESLCASHEMMSMQAMPGMDMAHHADGPVAASPAPHGARATPDCTPPAPSRCCDAMSGCSVTTAVGASWRAALPVRIAVVNDWRTPLASPMPRVAPEPPPPKA